MGNLSLYRRRTPNQECLIMTRFDRAGAFSRTALLQLITAGLLLLDLRGRLTLTSVPHRVPAQEKKDLAKKPDNKPDEKNGEVKMPDAKPQEKKVEAKTPDAKPQEKKAEAKKPDTKPQEKKA